MFAEAQEAQRRAAAQRPAVTAAAGLGIEANAEPLGKQVLRGAQHGPGPQPARREQQQEETMKRETISASGTAVLAEAQAEPLAEDTLIDEELLIEEISIDGMCGVY